MSSKRRGAGEGGIGRRKDGRWYGTVSAGWTRSGRRRHTVYGRSRAEVQTKLRDLQQQIGQGLPVSTSGRLCGCT
jgi:hypothetical protein